MKAALIKQKLQNWTIGKQTIYMKRYLVKNKSSFKLDMPIVWKKLK